MSAELLSAAVDLPFPALDRATCALRAARDEQARPGGPVCVLDWETLAADGPEVAVDPGGRSWFTYTAQVTTRALRPVG